MSTSTPAPPALATKVLLGHGGREDEAATRLAAELERQGFATIRVRTEGTGGGPLGEPFAAPLPELAGILLLPEYRREPWPWPSPPEVPVLAIRCAGAAWEPPLPEIVETLLPRERLRARLAALYEAGIELLDAIASAPFDQPWERRSDLLGDILAAAIETRRRLELRSAPATGQRPASFLGRFAALDRWPLDLEGLDWTGLLQARRLLVHELRNDLAVLHLVVDREECQPRPQGDAPDILAALERLRTTLAQAALAGSGEG